MASVYTNFGSPVSSAYNRFMGVDTPDYASSPIRYSQNPGALRPFRDVTKISTTSNLSPQERIKSQAEKLYTQQAAGMEAQKMLARDLWSQGIDWLNNAEVGPDAAANIYDNAARFGFTPGTNQGQNYMFKQPAATGPQAQANAYNRQVYGASNNANLAYLGINPSQVSKAYDRFFQRNYLT